MLVRCRNVAEVGWLDATPDETGWFGSKLVKKVGSAVSSVAKVAAKGVSMVPVVGTVATVAKGVATGKSLKNIAKEAVTSAIPGGAAGRSALRAAGNVAAGRNVVKSVKGAVRSTVNASPTGAKISAVVGRAASGENLAHLARTAGSEELQYLNRTYGKALANAPVVGTAASIGLGTAANLASGKSIASAARDAALQAVPGGELVQRGVKVGLGVARGQNVLKTVGREGIDYARQSLPGGEIAQRGLNVALTAASGGNIARAAAREGASFAQSAIPGNVVSSITSNLPKVPMNLTRPAYGMPRSVSPENVSLVRNVVGMRRPNMNRTVSPGTVRTASFRPLAMTTRNWLVKGLPHMRGEVSGLSETGAQWIVEKGDTGSGIALKLTGKAGRWTELKSVNPTIMNRGADLVKKYGFPIYVGDKVNLPASWIKPTAATPAQSSPNTPSPAKPPPVVIPAGDIAAQGQARTILTAWGKTDGKNESGVPDYGSQSEIAATSWSARDVLQGTSFANWWRRNGKTPDVGDGQWSDALATALNRWAEQKANQVTNTALAAGGMVIPPVAAPAPTAVPSPVNAPVPPPWQATPVVPPAPTTIPTAVPQITAPSQASPASLPASIPAPKPQAQAPQATKPTGLTDAQKFGWGSMAAGTAISILVRLMVG
jgi:hypothetical protein